MSVLDGVERDLDEVRRFSSALAESALAESARVLARSLDDQGTSATSKAMCAKALREAMDRLRELTPVEEDKDALDELRSRRAANRAGGAAA